MNKDDFTCPICCTIRLIDEINCSCPSCGYGGGYAQPKKDNEQMEINNPVLRGMVEHLPKNRVILVEGRYDR